MIRFKMTRSACVINLPSIYIKHQNMQRAQPNNTVKCFRFYLNIRKVTFKKKTKLSLKWKIYSNEHCSNKPRCINRWLRFIDYVPRATILAKCHQTRSFCRLSSYLRNSTCGVLLAACGVNRINYCLKKKEGNFYTYDTDQLTRGICRWGNTLT